MRNAVRYALLWELTPPRLGTADLPAARLDLCAPERPFGQRGQRAADAGAARRRQRDATRLRTAARTPARWRRRSPGCGRGSASAPQRRRVAMPPRGRATSATARCAVLAAAATRVPVANRNHAPRAEGPCKAVDAGFGTRRSRVLQGGSACGTASVFAQRTGGGPGLPGLCLGHTAAPGPGSSSMSPACIGWPQCAQRRSTWLISPHAWWR
jgi:hypothetical protein